MFAITWSSSVYVGYFIVGVIFTLFALLFPFVQPYKTPVYNVVDTVLLATVALIYFCIIVGGGRCRIKKSTFHITCKVITLA